MKVKQKINLQNFARNKRFPETLTPACLIKKLKTFLESIPVEMICEHLLQSGNYQETA